MRHARWPEPGTLWKARFEIKNPNETVVISEGTIVMAVDIRMGEKKQAWDYEREIDILVNEEVVELIKVTAEIWHSRFQRCSL